MLPIIIVDAIYNQQKGKGFEPMHLCTKQRPSRDPIILKTMSEHKNQSIDRDLIKAFDNAGKELGISFAVYEVSNQLYNSREEFYNTGLFNTKLNSEAHYNLNYLSYREYLTNETINNFI